MCRLLDTVKQFSLSLVSTFKSGREPSFEKSSDKKGSHNVSILLLNTEDF